ncbi:hypothetical protein NIES22_56390 [Calothrix brevissima NIES-22]|nr:hypothetical protein NIES22_56390 [Calothrix brevissima NIES-22]
MKIKFLHDLSKLLLVSKNTLKGWKIYLLGLNLTFLVVLIINSSVTPLSATQQVYVTLAHWNYQESAIIANENKLKIGLIWSVFSLDKKQYLGKAKVAVNNYIPPYNTDDKYSKLVPDRSYPEDVSQLILLRPSPQQPTKVNISKVYFSKLPIVVQTTILKKFSSDARIREQYKQSATCYLLDMDSDGSPEIVKVEGTSGSIATGYESVFVRSGRSWNVKYERHWTWE